MTSLARKPIRRSICAYFISNASAKKSQLFLALLVLSSFVVGKAQPAPIVWDSIPEADLQMTIYEPDSSAEAVVLGDYGSVFIFSSAQSYGYVLSRHRRIKILKKSGFDYGDVTLTFYHHNDLEHIKSISAQIILPDGQKSVLTKENVFVEAINGFWAAVKFSFPNITEGAIIEYKYHLQSKHMVEIQPWYFQESIPVRHSEYRVSNTSTFSYVSLFEAGEYMDKVEDTDDLTVYQKEDTRLELYGNRYLMQNAPALKEEAYITTMSDYRPRIRFQLSKAFDYGSRRYKEHLSTWSELAENLLKNASFGDQFLQKKNFKKLLAATKNLIKDDQSEQEKAAIIYDFLTQNLSWNGSYGIMASRKLDKAFATKQGSSAELNLMCLALLNAYDIEAKPLLTSTRNHGKMTSIYPLVDQFNHVLVLTNFSDGSKKILDISHELLPMGLPHINALNHRGWVVDEEAKHWMDIAPPTCRDFVGFTTKLKEDGSIEGRVRASFHNYSAYIERKRIKNEPDRSFWEGRLGNGREEAKIEDLTFKNLDNKNKKLTSSASFSILDEAITMDDFIYFTPVIYSNFDENPFKVEKRQFPVDFPYPFEEKVVLDIEFPEGYTIEELPEAIDISIPNGGANYQFAVRETGDKIQVVNQLSISQTQFAPDEYQELKMLFDQMIEKQGEQIVLKKKL